AGRETPRWSRPATGSAAHLAGSPGSIAGLPGSSAIVCVGPPFFPGPAGSSRGFVSQNELPLVSEHPEPVKPQVAPSSMLWPPSLGGKLTLQFAPGLPAMIVFVNVASPFGKTLAPSMPALLPLIVQLTTVRSSLSGWGPPPSRVGAPLPARVLFAMVSVPML